MQTTGSGGTNPATTMGEGEGEKCTSETLQPYPDETGPDPPTAPAGAEAGQADSTTEATVSLTGEAGFPSVSESPPYSVNSGNKEHEEPKGQHIDKVHP